MPIDQTADPFALGGSALSLAQQTAEFLKANFPDVTAADVQRAANLFATPESQHGDEAILTLFRQWRDGMEGLAGRHLDDDFDPLHNALIDTQRQLCDAEASGLIGLAIKAFMLAYEVQVDSKYVRGDHHCSINGFERDQYGAGRMLFLQSHSLRGLVVDAVRFLPELAPLAARIIAAPVVLPDDGNLAGEGGPVT
jgi:hypothetical protein